MNENETGKNGIERDIKTENEFGRRRRNRDLRDRKKIKKAER